MADERYKAPVNGIALESSDVDLISENAALAGDRVLAELLKLVPFVAASPHKAILPYGQQVAGGELGFDVDSGPASGNGLVVRSGTADARIRIRPFRAIIGSRDDIDGIGHEANWTDIRSALHVPAVADEWYSQLQLAATASNNRWDLVWARVDVDVPTSNVQRMVKSGAGAAEAQNVSVSKQCTVTLGVTQGTEATNPTPPDLPSDSGSAYYIPLAKIRLNHPHTLTTAIDRRRIFETAPVITLQTASVRPVSMASQTEGYANDTDNSGARTRRYAPASMVGSHSRFAQLGQLAVGTYLLDNSIDWRRRYFRWTAQAATQDSYGGPIAFPNAAGTGQAYGFATSLHASDPPTIVLLAASGSSSDGARILTSGTTAVVEIYVDPTTGWLMCEVTGEALQANVFAWLEASGAFDMQQATPAYG